MPLNVLNPNDKVEQLRRQQTTNNPQHTTSESLVSRFLDPSKTPRQKAIIEKTIAAIQQIFDPEIPVNIYDLGLIYAIDVDPDTSAVKITMTLTAPGCPVAGSLVAQVEQHVENIDEVPSATVDLTFDPPWEKSMMSEAAQLELGLL
jgi:FeS assembly SUF system protein